MKHLPAVVRSATIAVAICLAGSVAAKDLRYPQSGPVAFALNLPDTWTTKVDDSGNLLVNSPDRSSALTLTVTPEDANSLKLTADQFANAALAIAKAEPFNKHEPSSIGDKSADGYYSRMVNPSGVKIDVKMNVIKSVQNYIVSETILNVASITRAQLDTLATVLKGISLTAPSDKTGNAPGAQSSGGVLGGK
jgi:hypothetical protein